MESKKNSSPVVNIGSSSLLVIFIVLCLVTFATLSLSSAQSDYKFSQKLADRRTDYYAASGQAEEILDEIDTILAKAYEESADSYFSVVQKNLQELDLNGAAADTALVLDFSSNEPTAAYTVPITETQALSVVLALNAADKASDGFYQIRQWKVVSTAEWDGNQPLKLIQ